MRARMAVAMLLVACLAPTGAETVSPESQMDTDATLEITQDTLNRIVGRLGRLSDSGTYQPTVRIDEPGEQVCHHVGFIECPDLSAMSFELPGGGSIPGGGGIPGAPGIPGFGDWDRIPVMVCEEVGGISGFFPHGDPVPYQWWVTEAYFTLESGSMSFTATVRTRVKGEEEELNVTRRTVPATVGFDSSENRIRINVSEFVVPLQYGGDTFENVDVARLYSIAFPVAPQEITVPMLEGPPKTVTGSVADIRTRYLLGNIVVDIDVGF